MRCETRKGRKKMPRDDKYQRCVAWVQFPWNLCNGMRQTSSRVYGFIPAHATLPMNWIHCFYSASRVRIYEARGVARCSSRSLAFYQNLESSVSHKSLGRWRERQFARTADNILGRTRDKRVGPEGHSEISGTARVLHLFGDCASDSKGLANLIPQYAPVSE